MKDQEGVFLIVDDEPDMCWALEYILRKQGFASEMALNGGEALALVASNSFRLVFLDAKLPDMEGLELARRIREVDPAIRIVLVSGYFYKDDVAIQKALEEGLICGFIDKPFCHDEIIKYIKIAPSL
jgi:DNA-binding NtrC family response regulator